MVTGTPSDTLTMYRYLDRTQLEKAIGARGSVRLRGVAKGMPELEFNYLSKYTRPGAGDIDPATLAYAGMSDPLPIHPDNTSVFTLDGYAACLLSYELDYGIPLDYRALPNCPTGARHGKPVPVGTLVIEAPSPALKNFFSTMESHNGVEVVPLQLVHGPSTNQLVSESAQVQISNVTSGTEGDDVTYSMSLRFIEAPTLTVQ
jgi:hypothetical protein